MLSEDLDKPEGAPEWMVSYADMITILMSFFVVMFSIASGDSSGKRTAQQETVIASLEYRFGPKWKPYMAWPNCEPCVTMSAMMMPTTTRLKNEKVLAICLLYCST